eukprot:3588253-Pyramimonas_sp.AAC.1
MVQQPSGGLCHRVSVKFRSQRKPHIDWEVYLVRGAPPFFSRGTTFVRPEIQHAFDMLPKIEQSLQCRPRCGCIASYASRSG